MRIERDRIFGEIEPPPGGAARLRAKLAAPRPAPGWVNWLGPVAVASVAALAVATFTLRPGDDGVGIPDSLMMAADFDRLLGRKSEPLEFRITRGEEVVAVSEVASGNPKVRLYLIE